ncbi:MAG TPA: Stp1/IreP family PP2C-type Ser/Thr phosphatase [Rhabdochlamydiaceae bacterium]|nr:Stp1/IreP family PP2C-type Ser/Thr phosphatase [Rhabdochlamydiaceae bacterium]
MNDIIFECYGLSDTGLVRTNNEDAFEILLEERCFILADGMGGHLAGEVAAGETVSYLSKAIQALPKTDSVDKLVATINQLIKKTNEYIHALSIKNERWHGMGTTLCLALIHHEKLICAHVGDSRIYRIRHGKIERLTQDHSLKDELIAKGEFDESLTFLYKNVITRAIGTHPNVLPETKVIDSAPGDIYLLCTDGLTDAITDQEILSIILSSSPINEAAEALVNEANLAGGNDNITVVLFKII